MTVILQRGSAGNLTDLGDVQLTGSPSSGQVLQFNGVKWTNATLATAGIVLTTTDQSIAGLKSFSDHVRITGQKELRLEDAAGGEYFGLRAPNSLTGSVTLTLPNGTGTSGQALTSDGSGNLQWSTLSLSSLSNGSTVVLLAGRGGGQTVNGGVSAAEDLVLQPNPSPTTGLVKVNLADLALVNQRAVRFYEPSGAGTNYVAIKAAASMPADYTIKLPDVIAASGQQLSVSSVAGGEVQLQWITPGSSIAHSSLSGLTTGDDHPQYARITGRNSGQTIQGGLGTTENLVLESTAHGTKGLVIVAAGSVLAVSGTTGLAGTIRFYDEDISHYSGFKAHPTTTQNSVYTMPAAFPGSAQYLACDSGGNLSWGTPGGGGGSGLNIKTDSNTGGVTAATDLQFIVGDGLVITNPSGSIARVGLSSNSVPVGKLLAGSNGQVVVTTGGATAWGAALIAGGGTGLTSYTAGDMLYYSASTALSKLAIGSTGQQLSVSSGAPAWVEPTATELDSFRLEYQSTTEVRLNKLGNGRLRITINGRVYESANYVAGTNGALASSTAYFVYIYDNAGTLTMEFSATAPTTHTPDAYAAKTGDATRRYVGRVRTNASSQFEADGVLATTNRWYATRELVNDLRISPDANDPDPQAGGKNITTLYLHPFVGNRISLYDSNTGTWETCIVSSPISLSLSTASSANTLYDIFAYQTNGKVQLEMVAWSNSGAGTSARTTIISRTNGVWIKNGDATRRYLGTFRTTTGGNTEDVETGFTAGNAVNLGTEESGKRFIWNCYNQRPKKVARNRQFQHDYNGAAQQWRAEAANQIEFVVGVAQHLRIDLNADTFCKAQDTRAALVGLAKDTTGSIPVYARLFSRAGVQNQYGCQLTDWFSIGYHYVAVVQQTSVNTCTFELMEVSGYLMM